MKVGTIALHLNAIADVHDIIYYYRDHAGVTVAENFATKVDEAYSRLTHHRNTGTPRLAKRQPKN